MKSLEQAAIDNKRVLLRIGTDLPLSQDTPPRVLDDTRLRDALPTIYYLLNRQAKLIIAGHLGRPTSEAQSQLSLRPVFLHLSALLNKSIGFAPSLFGDTTKVAIANLKPGQIIGLENLRFDPDEVKNSRTFARHLSEYGEVYVDDAFSDAHNSNASTVAVTEFLPSYAGLTFEEEYRVLSQLLRHPARPFVVLIGGAKVADKLPAIKQLLQKADRILIGGAIANTFLAASGYNVEKSAVETELITLAQEILTRAAGKIILPVDFHFSADRQIFDIGPKTIEQFSRYLASAKTIFWNGNIGKSEDSIFANGSFELARVVADAGATTIVGGGNTTQILTQLDLIDKISFVSSGGGATLKLLAGEHLPAIDALG